MASNFKDRIVHTLYVKSFIENIFVPQFISTSYACIKNRGNLACVKYVCKAIRKIYENKIKM